MVLQTQAFLTEIQRFITNCQALEQRVNNSVHCGNSFENSDSYSFERSCLEAIRSGNYRTTSDQGNTLEFLVKSLFNRISLVNCLEVTNRETELGQ